MRATLHSGVVHFGVNYSKVKCCKSKLSNKRSLGRSLLRQKAAKITKAVGRPIGQWLPVICWAILAKKPQVGGRCPLNAPQNFFLESLFLAFYAKPCHQDNRLDSLPTIQQSTLGSTLQNQIKVYLSISDRSYFAEVKFRHDINYIN